MYMFAGNIASSTFSFEIFIRCILVLLLLRKEKRQIRKWNKNAGISEKTYLSNGCIFCLYQMISDVNKIDSSARSTPNNAKRPSEKLTKLLISLGGIKMPLGKHRIKWGGFVLSCVGGGFMRRNKTPQNLPNNRIIINPTTGVINKFTWDGFSVISSRPRIGTELNSASGLKRSVGASKPNDFHRQKGNFCFRKASQRENG